jgi:hypothetical protein
MHRADENNANQPQKNREAREKEIAEKEKKEKDRRDKESLRVGNAAIQFSKNQNANGKTPRRLHEYEFKLCEPDTTNITPNTEKADIKNKVTEVLTTLEEANMACTSTAANATITSVGSDHDRLRQSLQNGIYLLPRQNKGPEYKFQLKDGTITRYERNKFGAFGANRFDHGEYCKGLFALHALRGDKVVTINWPDEKYISEKKLEQTIEAALERGIEIKWGPKVVAYLNNKYEYNHKIGMFNEAGNESFFKKSSLDDNAQTVRKAKFEKLANETAEIRKKNEKEFKPFLDREDARKYDLKNNLSDEELKKEPSIKLLNDKGVVDEQYKTNYINDLDHTSTTKKTNPKAHYNEKLVKISEELKYVKTKLDEVQSAGKRLNKQHRFYENTITEAKNAENAQDKLKDIKKWLDNGVDHERQSKIAASRGETAPDPTSKTRNSLIQALTDEHFDLGARMNILKEQLDKLKTKISDDKQNKEQIKEMEDTLTTMQDRLKNSSSASSNIRENFEKLNDTLDMEIRKAINKPMALT